MKPEVKNEFLNFPSRKNMSLKERNRLIELFLWVIRDHWVCNGSVLVCELFAITGTFYIDS